MTASKQVFISYARKDYSFVDRLREDLKQADIPYWIDQEGLSPGTRNWERAIRKAIAESAAMIWVVSPAAYDSEYVSSELAVGEMHKLKIYPVWADGEHWVACVPLGKHNIQYVDMRQEQYSDRLPDLLKALRGAQPELAMPAPETPSLPADAAPRNPYKGLMAFTEKDAGDFYGRETLTAKLKQRIDDGLAAKQARFLAVLGPSGAGKSSVVLAGLIPALKQAHPDWAFLPKLVPGKHPLEALAESLYRGIPEKSLAAIESDLREPSGRMLHRLAQQIDAAYVLLYIDQFEELFTLTEDEQERQQFISLIAQAATEPDGKLLVLLSMRADFYGHPLNYPQLGTLVEANNVGILPMSIIELRDAIEKPARLPDVALTFDDGLVAEIIFALRERDKALASALPLLQFTLERLFAERQGTRLTFAAYHTIGGVEGAIGTHCEAVFCELPEAVQGKLGSVFLPLTNFDEESGEPTRRRAPLAAVTADEAAQVLVNALVEARLLQTGLEGDQPYLEITHEALFRSWTRLAAWIETAHSDLALLRQYERDAKTWAERGKDTPQPTHEALVYVYKALASLDILPDTLPEPLKSYIEPEAARKLRELNALAPTAEAHGSHRDIGDRLAVIGDPRAGIGVKEGAPDMVWLPVAVSPHPVTIKTDQVEIGPLRIAPFFIAQYQVTYLQYQAFVTAPDGFDNPEWWRDFPKDYQRQPLAEQRTKAPNNPRDSISWYQSVAFGRWLDHHLRGLELAHPSGVVLRVGGDAEVRLPLEWEWQWAAQGAEALRAYPWGDWQPGYANTSEAGLGRAIAVGLYPHGAAACGALDMAGNLLEWCQNDRDDFKVINGYGNEKRKVLRGGSFNSLLLVAAASYRYSAFPYGGDFNLGLRVVVAPLSRL